MEVPLQLSAGYHVNSATPNDAYLIPLRLTWDAGTLENATTSYPTPTQEKYSFSEKPLSVLTGNITLRSKGTLAKTLPPGMATLTGKLRFQACTDKVCHPPRTMAISVPATVK